MIFEECFKVSFTDIDKFNKIKPQAILRYLQEVGGMQSESVRDGMNYINEVGGVWIIIGWKVRLFKTLKWNDKVNIKTWSRKTEKFYAYRDYEMLDESGEKVGIASSKWVFISLETNSISKIPKELIARYGPEDRTLFETEIDKIKEPTELEEKYTYIISKRDIDINNHLNNSYYLDFAMEILDENIVVTDIEIVYKKECKLGEKIHCMHSKVSETEHIVTIKNDDLMQVNAIIKINTKI